MTTSPKTAKEVAVAAEEVAVAKVGTLLLVYASNRGIGETFFFGQVRVRQTGIPGTQVLFAIYTDGMCEVGEADIKAYSITAQREVRLDYIRQKRHRVPLVEIMPADAKAVKALQEWLP